MKKLVRFMLAVLMTVFAMMQITTFQVQAEEGKYLLAQGENSLDKVYYYGVYNAKIREEFKYVTKKKAPPKWILEGQPAFCSNVYFQTTEGNVYSKKIPLDEFLSSMEKNPDEHLVKDENGHVNIDGQLAAAYGYYAVNEVPENKGDLYYSAGQLLIWKLFNGENAVMPLKPKDGSTTDEQMNLLADAMADISKKAVQSKKMYVYNAYFYIPEKTGSQKLMGSISRSLKKNVIFKKYLVMDKDVISPEMNFNFEITPQAVKSGETSGEWQVYAGVLPQNTSSITAAASFQQEISTASASDCPVALKENEKCEAAEVNADFSQITFEKPGVYRYQIKESADKQAGIVNDEDTVRILDIYVNKYGSQYRIIGYRIYKTNGTKSTGFVNRYDTCGLTVKKIVSGNLASHDQAFRFHISFNHAPANTQLTVLNLKSDGTVKDQLSPVTVDENGEGKFDFSLKHGEILQIKGIAGNTGYSIEEDEAELNSEKYVPHISVEGDQISHETKITFKEGDRRIEDDVLTKDTAVVYENMKNGAVPTGINMPVLPAAAAAAGAVSIIVMMLKSKFFRK